MVQNLRLPDLRGIEKQKKTRKYGYLFFAFLAPCLLMYAIYFAFGVFPFGDESVLVLDLNAQYVYFFGALRRALHGDASLIYSFSRALGGEFIGIFAYYLSSPLSWIVALFPENMMLDALLVLFTTKCGLCGLTLAFYLDKHRIGTKPSRIIFGILYALCGYGVIYQHNTMWIDCMYLLPLVALGIEELIAKRKYLLFTLSLAIAIFSSFYIGYMMCIFCFIYFFYAYFCVAENEIGEKKHFIKSLTRMGIFSLIAIGLAACIILPTYYSLGFGKTTFSNPTYGYEPRFDLLDLVGRLFVNAYDTVRPDGLPIIYCGMLTVICIPLFFIAKKVPLRQKVGTGVLIGIFVLSFSIDAIDKFWHGMQAPNWLNYRYSFMPVFLLIVAAAKAFAEIRHLSAAKLGTVVGGWYIFLLVFQKIGEFYESDLNRDLLCIYISAAFLAIYAAAVTLFRNRQYHRAASSVLLVIVCAEMIVSGISSICYLDADVVYSTRSSYLDNKAKYEDSVDYILENDDSFFRFDKTKHSLINTPMSLGIRGFTNSTSTLNKDTIDFLRYMGLSSKSHWTKYYGATAPFDSFLGVKYVIADPEYDVPTGYIARFTGSETTVYENPYALSIAYAVNSAIGDVHLAYPSGYDEAVQNGEYEEFTAYYTPAKRMNVMMGAMFGKNEPVDLFLPIEDVQERDSNINYSYIAEHEKHAPINANNAASLYYTFYAQTDGIIYIYVPTDYPREASLLVNGVDKGTVLANETDRMISLGYFNTGDKVSVTLTLKSDCIYIRADEPLFWYVNTEVYEESFASLAENQFIIDDWNEAEFNGSITISEDRTTVFTSIPYDANWRVYADGEEVQTYEMLNALVAFDLTPGEHTLTIRYEPKQLHLGLAITFASAVLLLAIFLCERTLKKRAATKQTTIEADAVAEIAAETASETDIPEAPAAEEAQKNAEEET